MLKTQQSTELADCPCTRSTARSSVRLAQLSAETEDIKRLMLSYFKQPGEAANWTGWLTPQDRRRTKWGPEEPPLFIGLLTLASNVTTRQLDNIFNKYPKRLNLNHKTVSQSRSKQNIEPSNSPNNKQQSHFNQN